MEKENDKVAAGFVAGWFGGCVATVVSHPADTVKVRMQMEGAHQRYRNTFTCFVDICKTESVRGLYKGMAYPLCSQLFVNAVVFGAENVISIELQSSGVGSGISTKLLSGAGAGALQCLIVCPAELVKIKMQNQGVGQSYGSRPTGPWEASKRLYRERGIFRGFYRGWWLTIAREVPQYMIYFSVNHKCKKGLGHVLGKPTTELWQFVHSALAGGVTGVVTWLWYPADVIKSRFQNDDGGRYKGIADCYSKLIREGGYRMLYAGITPTLIRGFFNGVSTFVTVDFIKRHWGHWGRAS